MQCFEIRESENIKERRNIYDAREFRSFRSFQISNKINEIVYHFFKNIKQIFNLIC